MPQFTDTKTINLSSWFFSRWNTQREKPRTQVIMNERKENLSMSFGNIEWLACKATALIAAPFQWITSHLPVSAKCFHDIQAVYLKRIEQLQENCEKAFTEILTLKKRAQEISRHRQYLCSYYKNELEKRRFEKVFQESINASLSRKIAVLEAENQQLKDKILQLSSKDVQPSDDTFMDIDDGDRLITRGA